MNIDDELKGLKTSFVLEPLPARYEPMPRTAECFYKIMERDQNTIIKQAEEIGELKAKINDLEQKLVIARGFR